jgi:hypothetical protein
MPTATYTALATVTLGSAASSVTFSSIPGTYRDLILVVNGSSSANSFVSVRFNGDSGTNYGYLSMIGANTAYSNSATHDQLYLADNQQKANALYQIQVSIMDYPATDKHKTALTRTSSQTAILSGGAVETAAVYASAHRWANTAAITSVAVNNLTGNFNSSTTFNLYGVIA